MHTKAFQSTICKDLLWSFLITTSTKEILRVPSSLHEKRLLEEGEVDAAIGAVLDEAGMMGEVVLLAVLKDKEAVGLEKVAAKDDVGQLGYLRQGVWRVGKDEVELLAALCHELEDIAANGQRRCVLKLVEELLDEAVVTHIKLYADNSTATSADKFERNATRAGEEVECCRLFAEVKIALQDIEEVFLGKVRRWTCRKAAWHFEMPALVFASDDAHLYIQLRIKS